MHKLGVSLIAAGLLTIWTFFCSVSLAQDQDQALVEAAERGHLAQVEALLDKGANVNAHDGSGYTVFRQAVFSGNTDLVKLFLDKGADANAKDSEGTTVLILAAHLGHADIARLLLDRGGDPNAKDDYGRTALMYAAWEKHSDVVKELKAHGVEATLTIAAILGDTAEVQRFIDSGSDVNEEDDAGNVPLIEAVEKEHSDVVRELLDNGADINAKCGHGLTALMSAAVRGQVQMVELLLDRKACANAKDSLGTTALDHTRMTIAEEETGSTALDPAKMARYQKIVELLKRAEGNQGKAECDQRVWTRETITGEVVAYTPRKNLTVSPARHLADRSPENITVEIGTRTRLVPFRIPAVGEKVEIQCRDRKGAKVADTVRILSGID